MELPRGFGLWSFHVFFRWGLHPNKFLSVFGIRLTGRVDNDQDKTFQKKAGINRHHQERIQITSKATAQESFTPNRIECRDPHQKVRQFTPNVGTSRLVVLKSWVPFVPAPTNGSAATIIEKTRPERRHEKSTGLHLSGLAELVMWYLASGWCLNLRSLECLAEGSRRVMSVPSASRRSFAVNWHGTAWLKRSTSQGIRRRSVATLGHFLKMANLITRQFWKFLQ